jgi:hypothetical protein
MRTLRHLWPLILLPALAGCRPPDRRSGYHAALQSYTATLAVLVEMRHAGGLDDDEARRVETLRRSAGAALDAWREALERGGDPAPAVAVFNRAIERLIALYAPPRSATERSPR